MLNNFLSKSNLIKLIFSFILGTIFTYYINNINEVFDVFYIIKNICYISLFFWGINKIKKIKLDYWWIWILSIMLAFFTITGKTFLLKNTVEFNLFYYISFIILTIIFYIIGLIIHDSRIDTLQETNLSKKLDKTWIRCGIMFISYSLYSLLLLPGAPTHVDNIIAVSQIQNGIRSLHYPPLFSYINYFICELFGIPNALYVLTLCSIIIFILLVNRAIKLIEYSTNSKTRLLITLYFALNPIVVLWAPSAAKDVFFGMLFLLLTIETYIYLTKGLKHYYVHFAVYGMFCLLLRNNTFYIFIVWAIVIIFFKHKKAFKISAILLVLCAGFYINQKVLTDLLKFETDGLQEAMSVPLHQMHLVYKNNNYFTEEEEEFIKTHFDEFNWRFYSPQIADSSKEGFNRIDKEFIDLYLKTAKDNPQEFLDAFVSLTINSFYGDSIKNTYNEEQSCLFEARNIAGEQETDCANANAHFARKDLYTFSVLKSLNNNKFTPIQELIVFFTNVVVFEYIPAFSKIFSISTYTILYLIVFFILVQNKNKKAIISFIPFGILWGTILFGPCTLYRYYLAFIYLLPFLLHFLLKRYDEKKSECCDFKK